MKTKLICCNQESVWVENVPGKGYNFCKSCRKEVLTPIEVVETKFYVDIQQKEFDEELNRLLKTTVVMLRSS